VNSFHNGICLRVSDCDWFAFDSIIIFDHLLKISYNEFTASIIGYLSWPWVPREPFLFCYVGHGDWPFVIVLMDFEPPCGWIDHGHTKKVFLLIFVMTTDSDIFPIDANALLPFLTETNPEGDYHRVFVRDWVSSIRSGRTIALFGIGQLSYDWKRSLTLTKVPLLSDAVDLALHPSPINTDMRVMGTWGLDQQLSTSALINGELCFFPNNYSFWRQGDPALWVVSPNTTTASEFRDIYTCLKSDLRIECLDKYDTGAHCLYSHFTPRVTSQLFQNVYNGIAADTHHPMDQPYKTAEMVFGGG
jgi:hypothetical protein